MASFESGLECEDTRVDTDHRAAQDAKESAQHTPQQRKDKILPQCNCEVWGYPKCECGKTSPVA